MDVLYVILLIVIIVLLATNHRALTNKIAELEMRILDLQNLIRKLNQPKQTIETPPTIINEPQAVIVNPVIEKTADIPVPLPPKKTEPEIEVHKEPILDPAFNIKRDIPKPAYQPIEHEPQLSFFERYPDLEKFIGENLVNKIGIAILVLAIGFFVKYAIDNNWVGPAGRVGIGILCGGILIGIAHRLRIGYKAFSSVLVGGGLAIFYFTITLAYHEFHLFNQTTSFIILIVITCFAVVLSLLYDKQELAVIALVGGMSSPFMVSNGSANYNALFIYLIILNGGLLIIAYNKAWRILNITAFALTVLVLIGIIYTLPDGAYLISFIYISILYLMFFFINIAYNIRENKKFIASDFTILLVNTALYFSAGLYLLTMMHSEQFRGLFSAGIGALNLLFSFVLLKSKKAEINILYLLIGITLTFISLTAPIQLHGHFITLFWAAESVLLYWLYQKSNIKIIRLASLIIWCAMLLSLLMDWYNLYSLPEEKLTIIANKGFITTICAAIGSWLLYRLNNKPDENKPLLNHSIYKYTAVVLLFLSGLLEVNHQFITRYPLIQLNELYIMLYVPAFIYLFWFIVKKIPAAELNWQVELWTYIGTIFLYLLSVPQLFDLQDAILVSHNADKAHFIAHWVGVGFMILIFYQLILICKTNLQLHIEIISWALSATIVLFFSLEVCLLSNLIFYTPGNTIGYLEDIYVKTGLPVLWGISSFALMWLGMHYKTRVLRIISLTLFTLTLIKLFVFDIQNIPAAGKIAAFFCLGVLLLIISFMYQKVKNIIADDKPPEN